MKPNLGFYIQNINDTVKETEKTGDAMNQYFEIVRAGIDSDSISAIPEEELAKVHIKFSEGTAKYEEILGTIKSLKAPAKVIGIHKKLEKAYESYVASCQEMVDSIDVEHHSVQIEAFNQSEKKQDETTDTIAFCIQRMTGLLMK